jgi:hypothetical protein
MRTLVIAGVGSAAAVAVTPVQKVIEMLENMKATSQKRMEEEQVSERKWTRIGGACSGN